MTINTVTLVGNLGMAPAERTKYTEGGAVVCNIGLAVTNPYRKDAEGKPSTDWFNCVFFNKTAETLQNYAAKGDTISVTGQLRQQFWTDNATGKERYSYEIIVDELRLMPKRSGNGSGPADTAPTTAEGLEDW